MIELSPPEAMVKAATQRLIHELSSGPSMESTDLDEWTNSARSVLAAAIESGDDRDEWRAAGEHRHTFTDRGPVWGAGALEPHQDRAMAVAEVAMLSGLDHWRNVRLEWRTVIAYPDDSTFISAWIAETSATEADGTTTTVPA